MKHWILPTEKNNHHAKLLKPFGLVLLLVLYMANQVALKTLSKLEPGVLGYASEITVDKVLAQTNREREKAGLSDLTYNGKLSQSASSKGTNMFAENYWAHNSPSGRSPWSFFKDAGYTYQVAGENLAKDFYDTESLVSAWMNSPTHRANILDSRYKEIGIGVVNGTLNGYKTTLVIQHFGTPLAGKIADKPNQLPVAAKTVPAQIDEPAVQAPLAEVPKDVVVQVRGESVTPTIQPVNPHTISKIVGSIIFILLVGVMFIDGYVVLHQQHQRLTGSRLAHICFLIVIFILLVLSQQGVIGQYAAAL